MSYIGWLVAIIVMVWAFRDFFDAARRRPGLWLLLLPVPVCGVLVYLWLYGL